MFGFVTGALSGVGEGFARRRGTGPRSGRIRARRSRWSSGQRRERSTAAETHQPGTNPGPPSPSLTWAVPVLAPLLVRACLLLDGPADLPQMPPEGV